METRMFTLKTRSGLHCGIGQGLSDIDLPTAKESVSGYPLVPGSSLKGVLRDRFESDDANKEKSPKRVIIHKKRDFLKNKEVIKRIRVKTPT